MAKKDEKGMVVRNRSGRPVGMLDDMEDLFGSFTRDMERMLWDPFDWSPTPGIRRSNLRYRMPMDMTDEDDKYVLHVDLPGVKKDNVQISLENDILTLSVEGGKEEKKEDKNYLMKERSSFSARRCLQLPGEVDSEKIDAKMVDGVLRVELPKTEPEKHKPKKIEIK